MVSLAVVLHGIRADAGTDVKDKPPLVEAEKLPPRAVARLGSLAFYHGDTINAVALAPSGKLAATGGRGKYIFPRGGELGVFEQGKWQYDLHIRLWEVPSGRQAREFLVSEGPVLCLDFSPDGKSLIAGAGKKVFQWDVTTGKEIHRIRLDDYPSLVRFTPDGKHLLISVAHKEILQWDLEKRTEKSLWNNKGLDARLHVRSLDLTPDGSRLAILLANTPDRGIPGAPPVPVDSTRPHRVQVLDLATGKQLFDVEEKKLGNGVALSPDKKTVSFGSERVMFWDIAQGKKIRELPAIPSAPYARVAIFLPAPPDAVSEQTPLALSYSPDGKFFVSMHRAYTVLWDAESGKKIGEVYHQLQFDPSLACEALAFSRNSKWLAAGGSEVLCLLDTTTGKEVDFPQGHRLPIFDFRFTPDGTTLISQCGRDACFWQTTTWQQRNRRPLYPREGNTILGVSHEKNYLITQTKEDVFLEELVTGKVLAKFPAKEKKFNGGQFSFDGQITCLYTLSQPNAVSASFFSLPDCKELHQMELEKTTSFVFSPASNAITWKDGEGTYFEADAKTGKVLRNLSRPTGEEGQTYEAGSVFSWDNRYIIFRTYVDSDGNFRLTQRFWDFKTGRTAHTYPLPGDMGIMDFTYDNRLLVYTVSGKPGLRVLELASGKERRPLIGGHLHGPTRLATSPVNLTVASGMPGNTILVWDLAVPNKKPARAQLTDDELSALWKDLASDDALKAEEAIETLVQTPGQALPFLRNHLKPVASLEPKQLKRLISELSSENFAVREKASAALEKVVEQAEPALQRALEKEKPTVETRRRIEQLLSKLPRAMDIATLQSLRALEVVEKIGSTDAQQLIESLSRGAPAAHLTDDATEALRRLQRKR
jgi:WD40 repeat protein